MTGNAPHLAAAALALAALAIAAAAGASPSARGGSAHPGAAWITGDPGSCRFVLLLSLDAGDERGYPGPDRLRLGAALGWSAGIASAGVAALAIGDTVSGRHGDRRRGALHTLYAHFRLSPSILSTPDGNAGFGAAFTVLF